MTDLTAADKKEIQARLEGSYSEFVERFKERLAFFSKRADEEELTTGRTSYELAEYLEKAARSETLLDQFSKVTISKFTDAERQDFQSRLERRKDQLIQNFQDIVAMPDEMVEAAVNVVEIDALLQSFNKVTQVQAQTTAKPANKGIAPPRLRGH